LEIEREGLRKEKDPASKERLALLEKELADLKEQANALRARWEAEVAEMNRVGSLQEQLDAARNELERAMARYDYGKAAELKYRVTQLEQEIDEAKREAEAAQRDGRGRLVREEVTEEDIAEVVSKWTGIPMTRLLQGEMEKLVQME